MSPASDLLNSSSDAFKFAKLNGTNYPSWVGHMKAALQSKYLWLIITGDESCPPEAAPTASDAEMRAIRKERLEWMLRDQAAMGNIKGACEESQLPFIETVTTSKEMWEELKKVHQTSLSRINVHYLFEELYTRKYVDGSSMDEHIAGMLGLRHRIISTGEKLEDLHLAWAMVLSLPKTPSWELVKIPLFELPTLTSEAISTRILQEANRRNREKSRSEMALVMKGKREKGKGKSKSKGPQPTDKCRRCGKVGHWAKGCGEPETDKKDSGKKATGESAHLTTSGVQELESREVGHVYVVSETSAAQPEVLLDCAATSHIFADHRFFMRYVPSSSGETISDRDGLSGAGRYVAHEESVIGKYV